jgi:hypothetical protein
VTEADYLAALSEAVPMDAWRAVIAKAVEQARAGDAKAREWLGIYVVGKPSGDALLKLAASEMSGLDPVAIAATSFDPLQTHFARMAAGNGQPRDDDEAIAGSVGEESD